MKQPGCHIEEKRSFISKYLPYRFLPITQESKSNIIQLLRKRNL